MDKKPKFRVNKQRPEQTPPAASAAGTAAPEKKMIRTFSAIEKAPLQRGTGAMLCLAEKLGAFDRENLIVPISLI